MVKPLARDREPGCDREPEKPSGPPIDHRRHLEMTSRPSRVTRIVYGCNLNFNIVHKYLDRLIKGGFLASWKAPTISPQTEDGNTWRSSTVRNSFLDETHAHAARACVRLTWSFATEIQLYSFSSSSSQKNKNSSSLSRSSSSSSSGLAAANRIKPTMTPMISTRNIISKIRARWSENMISSIPNQS